MSGPVGTSNAQPDVAECGRPTGPTVEVVPSRTADVGGLEVRRALPRRQRRTIGAWCFADHFGPPARARAAAFGSAPIHTSGSRP
jgi:redox-sensitive bicupin YhaK (pirin superfamily)